MNGKLFKKIPSIKTASNYEDFMSQIKELKEANYEEEIGVAICMPGIINSKTGYVVHAGALRFISNLNLKKELENLLNCSVEIINDAKAAAVGEQYFGHLNEVGNGLSVVLGTGIGLGILINGKIYEGSNQASGELSFININNKSDISGFSVSVLSAVGMVDKYFEKKTDKPENESGKHFFKQIALKDEYALELIEAYCETLAIQLYNLQTLFDPEKIVIGGGISAQSELFEVLNKKIDEYGESIYHLISKPIVIQSKLGNEANLLGSLVNFKSFNL